MLTGGSHILCVIEDVFPGQDLYLIDPAQHARTADWNLGDIDRDLSNL